MLDPLMLDDDEIRLDVDTLYLSDDEPLSVKVSVRPRRRIISSGRPMNLSGNYSTPDEDSSR